VEYTKEYTNDIGWKKGRDRLSILVNSPFMKRCSVFQQAGPTFVYVRNISDFYNDDVKFFPTNGENVFHKQARR